MSDSDIFSRAAHRRLAIKAPATKAMVKPDPLNVPSQPAVRKRMAFFDTGMNCGFAVHHTDGSVDSGCWQLHKTGRMDSPGMRMVRLQALLEELHKAAPLSLIGFEEVRRHLGVNAAHSYGGLTWKIMEFAVANSIPYTSIPVNDIKRAATGRGGGKGTDKTDICKAAKKRWPRMFTAKVEDINDNQADAMFGLVCLAEQAGLIIY
jgi:hypothetical protein